jgi:hypothetical protein
MSKWTKFLCKPHTQVKKCGFYAGHSNYAPGNDAETRRNGETGIEVRGQNTEVRRQVRRLEK